ncbi:MAG: cyclic nucleotide-binding domain-containing protein, partial [Spirochaetes bacterium]|nr:cyclic nucleotide-binding domain-containing protein [Spirochaetota bacterium]
MKKVKVATGIYWIDAPEAGLFIQCGCPADSVKHLIKKGLIRTESRNGVTFETGPNAILLSDLPLQNERFSNLSEFPILQMFYRQGLIIPGHPNNTGVKPILLGIEDQVQSQAEYIFRGNYGLVSREELLEAGMTEAEAETALRMKRWFAFGRFRSTEDLLDLRPVGSEPMEIRGGLCIQRTGVNRYTFTLGKERIDIDLNLKPGEEYEAPFNLGFHCISRDYFSVIHSGEGDGWDPDRPCMASIICFQGKFYLIDAGPNLIHALRSLGISINEIEGMFHTHAHDDHFNGLTALMRSDHKVKYFAVPWVRFSVAKKLSALLKVPESRFEELFEIHDLRVNDWNDIGGFEVMPIPSPHPVETTIFRFRSAVDDGYTSYAHLADIASFAVLDSMVTEDPGKPGMDRQEIQLVKKRYLEPADLKKIDIGGGMIHGSAKDFEGDLSKILLLSHTNRPLTQEEQTIGSSARFGSVNVLIPSDRDYTKGLAFHYFQMIFPGVPIPELELLLRCPMVTLNPGTTLLRKGEKNDGIYLILSGILEYVLEEQKGRHLLFAGAMIGELSGIFGTETQGTFRALSFIQALKIPTSQYLSFLDRNGIMEETKSEISRRQFLHHTWLLGEALSCPVRSRIASKMEPLEVPRGAALPSEVLSILEEGEATLYFGEESMESIGPMEFFGEEAVLRTRNRTFSALADSPCKVWTIPPEVLVDIPVVMWKLLETHERRKRLLQYLGD